MRMLPNKVRYYVRGMSDNSPIFGKPMNYVNKIHELILNIKILSQNQIAVYGKFLPFLS